MGLLLGVPSVREHGREASLEVGPQGRLLVRLRRGPVAGPKAAACGSKGGMVDQSEDGRSENLVETAR